MINSQNLLYLVIGIGAIAVVFMTVKDIIRKPKKNKAPEPVSRATDKAVLPLQLQAYERLVLLVERINLQNLISRVFQPELSAVDMQIGLVQTIKAEFDHNVSQQIYVSPIAWDAVKTLKEQTITLINQVGSQLPQDASAMDLNKQLLELFLQAENSPSELTSQILNAEAKKIM